MRKNMNKEFEKLLLFQYLIKWNEGGTDLICNNDPPDWFHRSVVDDWAILTSSNPDGKQMNKLDNWLRTEEMRILLCLMDIPFHKVERISIDNKRFEPDGREISDAFLLINVKESLAKKLALQHQQEHFLFFELAPSLIISVKGCGKRFEGLEQYIST